MNEFEQTMQSEGQGQPVYTDEERRRFAYLGRWFERWFWLAILANIPALLTGEWMLQNVPALYWLGEALSIASAVAIGGILLVLAREEERYRTAGICTLIAGVASCTLSILNGVGIDGGWTLLISLPGAVIALAALCNRLKGSASLVSPFDPKLSRDWEKLWRWNLYLLAAAIILVVLMLILGFILWSATEWWGLLLLIGLLLLGLASVVIGIVEYVYLYRTAKLFQTLGGTDKAA